MTIDPNLLAQLLAANPMYHDPQVSQLPGPMADAQSQGMANLDGQSPEMMPALNYGQPHEGYLARFAAALAAHPLVVGQPGPHTSPWDTFGSNLLAGAGNALGSRSASQQHDQALRQAYAQQQALAYNQQQSAQAIERQRLLGILGAAGIRAGASENVATTGAQAKRDVAAGNNTTALGVQGLKNTGGEAVANIGAGARVKAAQIGANARVTSAGISATGAGGAGSIGGVTADDMKNDVRTGSHTGIKFVNVDAYKAKPAQRQGLVRLARGMGAVPLDERASTAIGQVDEVIDNLDAMLAAGKKFMPGGLNPGARIGAAIGNTIAGKLETNPNVTAFDSFGLLAIPVIKAFGGKGSGLRITQTELDRALRSIATKTDNYPSAAEKMQVVKSILIRAAQRTAGQAGQNTVDDSSDTVNIRNPNTGRVRTIGRSHLGYFKQKYGAVVVP